MEGQIYVSCQVCITMSAYTVSVTNQRKILNLGYTKNILNTPSILSLVRQWCTVYAYGLRNRLPFDGHPLIWSLKRVGVRYSPCVLKGTSHEWSTALRSFVPVLHLCVAKTGTLRVYASDHTASGTGDHTRRDPVVEH